MKRLIAIVEDEPAMRENYAAAFERHGYVVRTFSNRRLALTAFQTRLPDLALTAEPSLQRSSLIAGIKRMPVQFQPEA